MGVEATEGTAVEVMEGSTLRWCRRAWSIARTELLPEVCAVEGGVGRLLASISVLIERPKRAFWSREDETRTSSIESEGDRCPDPEVCAIGNALLSGSQGVDSIGDAMDLLQERLVEQKKWGEEDEQ